MSRTLWTWWARWSRRLDYFNTASCEEGMLKCALRTRFYLRKSTFAICWTSDKFLLTDTSKEILKYYKYTGKMYVNMVPFLPIAQSF